MNININLTTQPIIQAIKEPVVLPDDLDITFDSNIYNNISLVVTATNGKERKQHKLSLGSSIGFKTLIAGELSLSIDGLVKGNIVKHWEIVPIIIKEVNGECVLADKLLDLEARVATLEENTKSRF